MGVPTFVLGEAWFCSVMESMQVVARGGHAIGTAQGVERGVIGSWTVRDRVPRRDVSVGIFTLVLGEWAKCA